MIENIGLIEYLLSTVKPASPQEETTARQVKRFTDEMPGGFFVYRARDGKIIYVNQAVLRAFGCADEAEFEELTGNTFDGMVYHEDLAAVKQSINQQIFSSRYDLDYVEYRIRRKDGVICWVEDFGHYIETESMGGVFYVFLADVTERRNRQMEERAAFLEERLSKEQQLQKQIEVYNQFLEQMNDELTRRLELIEGLSTDYEAIFHVDLEQDVIQPYRVSSRKTCQFGRDLQVRPFLGFAADYADTWVHPEDRALFLKAVDPDWIRLTLRAERSIHVNYRVLQEGKPEYLQFFIVNVSGEEVSQLMYGCRSVDAELRKERERTSLLESALEQAKKAGEARSTFLSNMSHDMRTPMNAIVGFSALARRHLQDPERLKKDLEQIEGASGRLLRLVNDVLELSWLESGRARVEQTEFDILEVVRGLERELQRESGDRGVSFSANWEGMAHSKVCGDRRKLEKVLHRLCLGGIKRAEAGSRVEMFLREQNSSRSYVSILFEIICQHLEGGTSESALEEAFAPLERKTVTAAGDVEGADLGLSIAKHVLELMGGTVAAAVLPESGCRLTAALGLRLQEVQQVERTGKAESGPRRVLVVEDNELNREIAVDLLEDAGFLTDTAANGKIALEKVEKSRPGYYSMILMDLRMPVMDGHTAARAIRALEDPALARIPIVALSANTFDEDRMQSAESGMNAHLAKPLDISQLMALVERMTCSPEEKEAP